MGQEFNIQTISDANVLVNAFNEAKKGVTWKGSVQEFEIHLLSNIYHLKCELETHTYQSGHFVEFPLCERGKTRWIKSMHVRDRVIQRAVCDNILLPATKKYYIYDNGASLKGKGLDFAMDRLKLHLQRYYREYGTNEGYIVLVDFTKYFDNIPHDTLLKMLLRDIHDPYLQDLITYLISLFEIEIGFLPQEMQDEYEHGVFNSLEYTAWVKAHPEALKRPYQSKKLYKSVGIGSQISQIAGILYPTPIDNYFKIVRGCKYFGRYMDDTYIIVRTLEEAQDLLENMFKLAEEYGIHINKKKTQIVKLNNVFTFLKIRYHFLPTGRIIRKVSQDTIVRQRRKMKKLDKMLQNKDSPVNYPDIYCSFQSCRGRVKKFDNTHAVYNLNRLHDELFIDNWHCEPY